MKTGGRPTSRARSPGERIPKASTIQVVYGLAMELAKGTERGARNALNSAVQDAARLRGQLPSVIASIG
jgi:hypothetical protein